MVGYQVIATEQRAKLKIVQALRGFAEGDLAANALELLDALGYRSDKRLDLSPNTLENFIATFGGHGKLNPAKALIDEWESVDLLFQLTGEEIAGGSQLRFVFETGKRVDDTIIESYLFFAGCLKGERYTRGQLASITREINKLFPMPAMVFFRHGGALTLSTINRRLHKRDEAKDVLEKVTLIKDIILTNPHRAHVEILFDLSLAQLHDQHGFTNFVELQRAWQKTLDSSELNKRFFREIANWYFWAIKNVTFPSGAGEDEQTRIATSVIRLITRLIFVWFLKEKGLVPDDLFNRRRLEEILNFAGSKNSTYYKAILQNLFFATLNQEMNTPGKRDKRCFRREGQNYNITTLYRYEGYFKNPDEALELLATIPFLNGGLFDCLDKLDQNDPRKVIRIDGFSDRPDNELVVPDFLFFSDERDVDLNEVYATTNKRYKTRGLVNILSGYKFTVEENTPIEEEIALDPELLGRVFENLLAAYNPETGVTARKQTGSFYTPREIVDYMVDESLIAYLENTLVETGDGAGEISPEDLNQRLRDLLAYNDESPLFDERQTSRLIEAIDAVKILDPACGSGAFPMGVLHKLVFILSKLDPGNQRWKEKQIAKAEEIPDSTVREAVIAEIEQTFGKNELDYGRKLFLIQNCIYGVDIQPIAIQIAKLRFFTSLVVDQRIDDAERNRGILPLPNLETKFVAANTLLGLGKQLALRFADVAAKEQALVDVRRRHFVARTPATKAKYRELDAKLRGEISVLLKSSGLPGATAEMLANWDPYDQNSSAGFFDPEWMFGVADGFDLVIGNPPYVRQEQIKELKPRLQKDYSCYTGTADLYVYFYERGFQLLKNDGVLTFISSNKYLRSAYGEKLRGLLSNSTRIDQLIDFGDAPVFSAISYPSIIVFRKGKPDSAHVRAFPWELGAPIEEFANVFRSRSFLVPQKKLTTGGWHLERPLALQLLEKLRQKGRPLGEFVNGRFFYGIKTGLNEAFIVDRSTRDGLIARHPSSAQVLKPLLRGKDVKRWRIDFADQYLIKIESSENRRHPWSGKPDVDAERVFAEAYPAVHARFQDFREDLIARDDQGKYFWELRSCAYWREFEQPKIVYPDIAQASEFAFDSDCYCLANTLYLLPTDQLWLLGLLNSKIVFWFYTKTSSQIRGGFVRFIAHFVSGIPIPAITEPELMENLVSEVHAVKRIDPFADVSALEALLDQLAYRLYGLTADEIAMVEDGIPG